MRIGCREVALFSLIKVNMTQTLAQQKFKEYQDLPERTGTLLKMIDGHEVEFVSHFDEMRFSGVKDDSRYDNHEYHFKYEDIDHVVVYG